MEATHDSWRQAYTLARRVIRSCRSHFQKLGAGAGESIKHTIETHRGFAGSEETLVLIEESIILFGSCFSNKYDFPRDDFWNFQNNIQKQFEIIF